MLTLEMVRRTYSIYHKMKDGEKGDAGNWNWLTLKPQISVLVGFHVWRRGNSVLRTYRVQNLGENGSLGKLGRYLLTPSN